MREKKNLLLISTNWKIDSDHLLIYLHGRTIKISQPLQKSGLQKIYAKILIPCQI